MRRSIRKQKGTVMFLIWILVAWDERHRSIFWQTRYFWLAMATALWLVRRYILEA
jgi:hypothetical protein